jgi:hypothetical protein
MITYNCALDFIGRLKRHYDNDGEEAITELPDMLLDEEYECAFYELMFESCFLISVQFNEETFCSKYFFSSDEMTEYYRLAKKIGRLVGWSNKKNPYIDRALSYTIKRLDKIATYGSCYGDVYCGTKHRYASSVNVYVYEEGFYDYEGLYFAANAIWHYYERELKKLKRVYLNIIAICLSLLVPQELEELEVAA